MERHVRVHLFILWLDIAKLMPNPGHYSIGLDTRLQSRVWGNSIVFLSTPLVTLSLRLRYIFMFRVCSWGIARSRWFRSGTEGDPERNVLYFCSCT